MGYSAAASEGQTMKARAVGLLVVLGVIAIAVGWYFGTATSPGERTTVAGGKLMFPDLTPRLQNAEKIEVTHQGKQTVIEKRADGGWGIAASSTTTSATLRGAPFAHALGR